MHKAMKNMDDYDLPVLNELNSQICYMFKFGLAHNGPKILIHKELYKFRNGWTLITKNIGCMEKATNIHVDKRL